MALEEISKAVMESVQHEAELIIKSAQKEAEEKKKNAQKTAEENAEVTYQTAIRNIDDEMARRLIQVQGQINKQVLQEKNQIINQIFRQAKDEVLNLSSDEYSQLMRRILEKSIPQGTQGCIRVHKDDVGLFQAIVNERNASAGTTELTIDENEFLSDRGGFLFIGKGYQIDRTLNTILSDLQRDLVPVIAQKLFTA